MPTSHTVARNAVLAARATGATSPPHPAVWQPWEKLGVDAGVRFRTEIAAALAALEHDQTEAGKILDVAYSAAAGAAHPLRQAAYTAFHKYMTAADESTAAVMTPAIEAYDQVIAHAHDDYARALADATQTYKVLLRDAQAAKSQAATIAATV